MFNIIFFCLKILYLLIATSYLKSWDQDGKFKQ